MTGHEPRRRVPVGHLGFVRQRSGCVIIYVKQIMDPDGDIFLTQTVYSCDLNDTLKCYAEHHLCQGISRQHSKCERIGCHAISLWDQFRSTRRTGTYKSEISQLSDALHTYIQDVNICNILRIFKKNTNAV